MMTALGRDKIVLKNFETLACHGVNPEEKTTPQRFLIDVEIYTDVRAAAKSDCVDDTVSYSAVKKLVKSYVEGNSFDLIETLAAGIARQILERFALANGVTVEVKKPDAPMSGSFDHVSVQTSLEWHRIYISLGSNEGDRAENLNFAAQAIASDPAFKNVRESSRIATSPYGGVADAEFLNSAIEADTYLTPDELLCLAHTLEAERGRTRDVRWGNRTLDIDIIFYDDLVCDRNDLSIPHYDMINREFVLKPLAELNPNKVHPLLGKTVKQLLAELKR